MLYHLCASDVKGVMPAWGKLFHKSCFNTIRFPFGKLYEDAHINYKIYFNAKKISYSSLELYFYRIRSDSITGQTKSSIHALEAMVERYFYLKQHNETEAAKACLPNLCWDLLFAFAQENIFKEHICGFEGDKDILRKYRTTVNDYKKINSANSTHLFFLKLFAKLPSLYIFYRKICPTHLHKF